MATVPRNTLAPRILWPQVWGLASVQGAITLSWVIYNLYLVRLLTQYGFSEGLATGLIVLETGAAVLLEPLMGSLSDRLQRWMGSRFPMVAVGVIIAAACFLAIPLNLVLGGPAATGWLLPVTLVAWAFSMTIFRSPVLSLLGRYAMATQQPQAASILTLVGGVTGALAPLAGDFIIRLGPLIAFLLGSVVMLGAALVLRLTNPDHAAARNPKGPTTGLSFAPLAAIFAIGSGVTLGLRLLLTAFGATLVPLTANPGLVMGLVFLSIAALAFPMGRLARRSGTFKGMAVGLGALAVLSLAAIFTGTLGIAVLLAIAIGGGISLISNCTIPLALAAAPPDRAGLGTGLYFGGAALASSVFAGVVAPANLGVGLSLGIGAAALLLAIVLIQPIRLGQTGLAPK